jgi:hypothetical protein
VVRRRCDRQHPADRLDLVGIPMFVDEGDHDRNRRSSSAWAKYALAFLRISLACRSSRFSRSSALIRSRSSPSLVRPVHPGHVRPDAPSCATSHPRSRSWRRSSGLQPTASRARSPAPGQAGPPVRGPQGKTVGYASRPEKTRLG